MFGYDNVDVVGPDGRRSHVERCINEAEASVVRRIFDLRAEGVGQVRIAHMLNAEGVQCHVLAAPVGLHNATTAGLAAASVVWGAGMGPATV